ncbi:MAG: DUF3168 domain-containing protein [Alphaproteobacteria bacterium]
MSGAEDALESAILAVLVADAGVRSALGDPPRVFEVAEARPAYPYLEIVRHEVTAAGSQGSEANEHRIDLAIVSREGGRREARAALTAVRGALAGASPTMESWRCVLLIPVFADPVCGKFGAYRALLRIKAVVEPA